MSEPENKSPTPEEQREADAEAGFLGFLTLATIVYFAFVFWQLPEGRVRWLITGALAVLVVTNGLPSRMATLRATIKTERNLQHVEAWKSYAIAEDAAERTVRRPMPEAPPEAAPLPA